MTALPDDDNVVPLHKPALTSLEIVPDLVAVPNRARAVLLSVAGRRLPGRRQVWASTKWWSWHLVKVVPWLIVLAVVEIKPILRGLGNTLSTLAHWASSKDRHEYARMAEGNTAAKLGTAAAKSTTARRWTLLAGCAVWSGAWIAVWLLWPLAAVAATVLVLAALDFHGRRLRPGADRVPAAIAIPRVLGEGVPLSQITAAILEVFDREGFEPGSVGVAEPLVYDFERREYRISLATRDAIRPEHLRAIERAVGARDYAIRNLASGTATVRQLIIQVGDPLAGAQECEWIPTGSLSFVDALPLGRTGGEIPMNVRFVGTHTALVGRTRSGKTEGALWTIIDRLAACRDVVVWGIDLQAGPAFPLWRGVIQKVAYTPDDALALIEAAIVEMGRRKTILTRLAESDDEDDDDAGTVWTSNLGPYMALIIDEFALTSTYNGEKGRLDLMGPLEEIIRTGLKFGVHLIIATQKTGNSDFGSSVMQTQIGLKFLLACTESDTVRLLSTAHRDAGWSPHLLKPAQDDDPADAGKAYIEGPQHRLPDVYRFDFWPRGSVKRRARQRVEDGLPRLDGRVVDDVVDAVEVPPVLAAVEVAFREAGNPARMATAELLDVLADAGFDHNPSTLAAALKPCKVEPTRWNPPGSNPVRGYLLADVRRAIRDLS